MINNGWISVFDSERPDSKEEVLTLSYAGDFPAPANMFEEPDDRVYGVCTYYYEGDTAYDEALVTGLNGQIHRDLVKRIIDKEGFYIEYITEHDQLDQWRRIATLDEGNNRGIVCWKHLDYPSPIFD